MIDDLIKKIASEKSGEWIAMLTSKLGFTGDQASGFIPAAISRIQGLFTSGGLDISKGVDVKSIMSKLNPAEIGKEVGVDADKATKALEGVVPDMLSTLEEKSGGLSSLLSGGLGGAMGKLGKMFD